MSFITQGARGMVCLELRLMYSVLTDAGLGLAKSAPHVDRMKGDMGSCSVMATCVQISSRSILNLRTNQ